MNLENMKEIAKRAAIEHFSNPEMLDEVCTPDFTAHFLWGDEIGSTKDAITMLKQYIAHPKVVIHDCFAENDRVTIRFSATFSNQIGAEVTRNEISILRFEGEKIAEWWAAFDRNVEEGFWGA